MRIFIVTCVFPPEPIVSANTSYSLAVGLTQHKHNVRVITNFPNRPEGKLFKSFKRSFFTFENDTVGFRLVRCFSTFSQESLLLSRWLENVTFGLASSIALLFSLKPDVVYLNTWPIFATGLTCLVCKIRGIPFVLSVQDIYPESLVVQRRIEPEKWLYKLLFSIDQWISKQASEIIVISDIFARVYTQLRRMDPDRVHIISNWVDQNSVMLLNKNIYRIEKGISETAFVIVYGGNVGEAAGVEKLIEAMGKLKTEMEIVLIVAGSGSHLSVCKLIASNISNVSILFHSPWESNETSKVLSAADLLILPTRGDQSIVSVPSKLLSYMLVSRPVLATVLPESETAQVIKESGCGWVVPPDNEVELANKINEVIYFPCQVLESMGLSGRRYALNHFTTKSSLPKVIEIIENVNKRTVF